MDQDNQSIIFATERFIVRPYQLTDQENFHSLNGNPDVMQYIRPVKTREESDAFLIEVVNYSNENPLMGRWAVEDKITGEFVGSFAVIPISGEEEKLQVGYSMLPDHWGRGIATELTMAGLEFFKNNFENQFVYGITEVPNKGSQNVLLKAGFEEYGSKMEQDKKLLVFRKQVK